MALANLSISSFPSDLPCTSSEHIYFSGKVSRSYREKTGKWAPKYEPQADESSAARNEQFSAIDYEYKLPSAPSIPSAPSDDDLSSILPSDDSEEQLEASKSPPTSDDSNQLGGTVIHTPYHNHIKDTPRAGHSALEFDPLSSFTVHQVDKPANCYERSFVDQKAYPTTVRQVHGSLSLHNEKLVKAITDVTYGELNWNQIKSLDISGKGLTSLHGLDQYCPSIRSLNIDNNSVESLDGCPAKLRILSARNNRLSNLTSWGHLIHLCRVNAADNKLKDLDGLAQLSHLTELNVSGNRLKNINGLAALAELRKLDVSNNFLERVEWGKWHLQDLVELNMSNNMLYTIDSLDALPRLEKLNLEINEINSFNDDSRRCHMRLREINLKRNSIMSFEFWSFPFLQVLDLDENLVMSAASLHELSQAKSLIKLSLRNQHESCQGHENILLDSMMNTRAHFQELYLSENVTRHNKGRIDMPTKFKHRNIRILEMAACGINRLPTNFGQYFPACHTMNLNHNSIKDIAELRGLDAVEKLLLANNKLDKPKSVAHLMLPELRVLDLRDNTFNHVWYNKMHGGRAEPTREYPPGTEVPGDYELPGRVDDMKSRWFKRLPDIVQLKRLFINLLLAQSFPTLIEFDGASWNGQHFLGHKDVIMGSLREHGMVGPRRCF